MSAMSKYRVITIPNMLIDNYKNLHISEKQLVSIIKLIALNKESVSLSELISNNQMSRDEISDLIKDKVLSYQTKSNGDIVFDIDEFFQRLERSVDEKFLHEENVVQVGINVRKIIDRNLLDHELKQLEEWLEAGYSPQVIKDAFKIMVVNGVDNFKYVEKILETNK